MATKAVPEGYHSGHSLSHCQRSGRSDRLLQAGVRCDGADAHGRSGRQDRSCRDQDRGFDDHAGGEQPEMGYRGPQSLGGTAVSLMVYVEEVDRCSSRRWPRSAGAAAGEGPVLRRSIGHAEGSVRARVDDLNACRGCRARRDTTSCRTVLSESASSVIRAAG